MEALGGDIDSDVAPDDWIRRLAALPLIDQPGATLHYGHSTDLLGLLIARIEDAPLGEVLKRRIFDPLGMSDTSFRESMEPLASFKLWLQPALSGGLSWALSSISPWAF